ncbi:unnamed protein product [Orchesella dallaii]|uniref:Uncharacterized protein n=1 Tax=Orchesella dallaii TaxID=48710 RepID=A0ABP1S457_9HEXA
MIAVILWYVFSVFLIWFMWDLLRSQDTPPGPFKFPLLGTLVQISLADPIPYKAFEKLAKKYGDVVSIKLGLKDAIVLNSYQSIRDVFTRDEALERPVYGPWWDRNFKKDLGIIFSSEELWVKIRKFVTKGFRDYGFGKKNSMEAVIHEELQEFTDYIQNLADSSPGNIVHFDTFYHLTFLNLVLSMLVGKRYKHDDKQLRYVMDNVNHFFKSGVVGAGIMTAYPFLRYVFPTMTGFKIQMEAIQAYHSYAREVLKEQRQLGDYKTDPQCFADEFIHKIEETKNDPNTIFTDEQFIILVVDFIQAGSETTSNVFNVAMLHLALNQEMQDKLYKDIVQVIGTDRYPNLKDIEKLTYAKAVMYEAHRYSIVLPHLGLRQVTRDFYYNNYLFRKGTQIFPNIPAVSYDKEFWGDPENFRPERFIGAEGQLINLDRNLNFGAGKRNCIGEMLSKDSFLLYLTRLIQKFKFSIPDHLPAPRTDPMLGFSLTAHPYDAKIELRL